MTPRESFEGFARFVHEHTPDGYTYQTDQTTIRERIICGLHGRKRPARGACPECAGVVVPDTRRLTMPVIGLVAITARKEVPQTPH